METNLYKSENMRRHQEVTWALQFQRIGPAEIHQRSSGGERNRVHLAKLLKKGANFLLLDEPTNDLDVETLQALENAIQTFPVP